MSTKDIRPLKKEVKCALFGGLCIMGIVVSSIMVFYPVAKSAGLVPLFPNLQMLVGLILLVVSQVGLLVVHEKRFEVENVGSDKK